MQPIPLHPKCYLTGMDSLMAVEIKQTLEREFEVTLSAADLRSLTFAKLQEITDSSAKIDSISNAGNKQNNVNDIKKNILLRSFGNEQMANENILPLNEIKQDGDVCALFIPGIEGVINPSLYALCKDIEIPMYALQLHLQCREESFSNLISSISNVSEYFLKINSNHLRVNNV